MLKAIYKSEIQFFKKYIIPLILLYDIAFHVFI